ncbi:MAG: hypothetical protein RLZZ436_2461 [Planctomycetota bacterium]
MRVFSLLTSHFSLSSPLHFLSSTLRRRTLHPQAAARRLMRALRLIAGHRGPHRRFFLHAFRQSGCQSLQGRAHVEFIKVHVQDTEAVDIRQRRSEGLFQIPFRMHLKPPAGTQ